MQTCLAKTLRHDAASSRGAKVHLAFGYTDMHEGIDRLAMKPTLAPHQIWAAAGGCIFCIQACI